MKTFDVAVTQIVRVSLDESKFDEAFLAEFRESFYPFHDVQRHAEHIGQLIARGLFEPFDLVRGEFIEGYGTATDFGLSAKIIETDISSEPSNG